MAFQPGKGAFIMIDGIAGTLVNVSAYADNFSFPQPIDTHDVSVFGTNAKQFIPGLTDGGQISMSGPLDVALGTFVAALKAAQAAGSSTASVVYGPGGSVAGQIRQNAEVYVSSYDVSTSVGGRVEYSASLQVTGTVTNTTW
jgi:hypothetical protein